ncbi:MAG TPA: histidine kinase [Bacteroidetes bacterium]|nr:histidine kinase [Bacteroidota bacterium]
MPTLKTFGIILLFWVHLMSAQQLRVTILVEPSVTARDSGLNVFIAGNRSEFGKWNPSSIRLERISDSLWKFESNFDTLSFLEFKITAGSWEQEALFDSNKSPTNTTLQVTKDTTLIIRPLFWKRRILQQKPEPMIRGKVDYHRQLGGDGLNHNRDIIVWLPPSYEKNTKKHYPVLYMHDGQNIFDPTTAFTGYDWRVDEVADSLIRMKVIEEIIIVGIYNSPDRLPEYSDSELGSAYMNFVINVVKALVDSTYRTKQSKEHTGIIGSSLGGLSSLLFVWKRPDVFGMAGCLSPSFWYDDEKTLKEIREYSGHKKHIKIYLDCGGREKELISGYKRMVEILKTKGYKKGKDLDYTFESNGTHSEHYWAKRVWRPLVFMFGRR